MKKILLTGATGYIGKRLLAALLENNYQVICCTRDKYRLKKPENDFAKQIEIIEVDFLKPETLTAIPEDIDGAYYLMHSMSGSKDFEALEQQTALNFTKVISKTRCQHVIYLTGIVNEEKLSKHLASRLKVEEELGKGSFHFTALRAGIIIGSGSASFEIIRDLVEKLPVMVTPRWLHTKCQPIGIANVLDFLIKTLFCEKTYDKNFDIACPDVLTYKEMLLGYAKIRGLKRYIYTLPVMTPRLSSYWLYFITSTTYRLAVSLVDSMKIAVVARDHTLNEILSIQPFGYEEAIKRTLSKIEAHEIVSSWRDSFVSSLKNKNSLEQFMEVPKHGCFVDLKSKAYQNKQQTIDRIWSLGGAQGWYAQSLWKLRGFIDQIFGGVGLRRGRTHPTKLAVGDALDFWRVLYADREEGKLLLFAEMKLPGEAWLEFKLENKKLRQKAVFRPKGILGRLYWYTVFPFHGIVFKGMVNYLATGNK